MSTSCNTAVSVPSKGSFVVWDYVVFAIVLACSIAIGLYHALTGGRQRTTREFLQADKSMSALPVALSVFASFFSASTLLGTPAEIYMQGTMYWICVWGAILTPIVGATIFGPFIHKMKILSVFQYLEMRFKSRSVRLLGAIFFIVKLGGMKAVIWTDVFQTVIMLAGLLAAIIQGSIETGGIVSVWNEAQKGGRIEFFDFNPDPTVRHTFWTLVVGNFFVWLPPYSIDQQMIQRYTSTTSLRQATLALFINIPSIFLMISLCSLLGLIMYAYYSAMDCDPLKSGRVKDPNQLVPRFVMDIFGFAPGIPGLFVAALFSGALSSVSSMLNSLAAVVWEDFIKLIPSARKTNDKTATVITKLLAACFAGIGIGMAFLFSTVGGTVLQMSLAFNGAAGAPMVGLFILGAFFPWANWIGALVGGILGFSLPMWISIGAYVEKPPVTKPMYYSLECCNVSFVNMTSSQATETPSDYFTHPLMTTGHPQVEGIVKLYTLSYLWYTAAGILTTVIVGMLVSFMTGHTKVKDVDSKYLISYVDKFWFCFPEKCRFKFRCGVDYNDERDIFSDSIGENEDVLKTMETSSNERKIVLKSNEDFIFTAPPASVPPSDGVSIIGNGDEGEGGGGGDEADLIDYLDDNFNQLKTSSQTDLNLSDSIDKDNNLTKL